MTDKSWGDLPTRDKFAAAVLMAGIAGPFIVCMKGIFLFVSQIAGWLRTGTWAPHPLFEVLNYQFGMSYPHASWWAIQKLLDWLLAFPASVAMTAGGFSGAIAVVFALIYPLGKLGLLKG